jgi:hypothetical protein
MINLGKVLNIHSEKNVYCAEAVDISWVCRHQLGPIDLLCDLVLDFLYGFFVSITYRLVMGGIEDSHYHCVGVYIYS